MERSLLKTYPNPVSATSKVVLQLAKPGKYTLNVYNINGALVKTIGRGESQPGRLITHDISASTLSRGTYIIKLITDAEVVIDKIVIQ
jgi:hypothetical protein